MKRLIRGLAVVALVCGGLVGGGWFVFSHVLHYEVRTVTSGSMEPLFIPGSRVIVKVGAQPQVGSVVMFKNVQMHGNTTHVYLGTNPNGTIQTKGLANRDKDNFWPAPTGNDIIGTVVYHTEVFTGQYWTSRRGIGILLLFTASGGLFVYLWWTRRQEKKGDNTARENGAEPSASIPV